MFAYKTDNEKLNSAKSITLAILASLFGGFTVGMCSLFFASGEYAFPVWGAYLRNPYLFLLNLLPPIIISAIFFFIFNRAVWSFAFTNATVMVPTLINYFKMFIRGDCFVFEDIGLASEAGQMVSNYKLPSEATVRIAIYAAVLIIGCTLLAIFIKGRLPSNWHWRYAIGGGVLALSMLLIPVYSSDDLYLDERTANVALDNAWTDTEIFKSKGFVYPFLHSVKDVFKAPPEDYDTKKVESLLSRYEDTPLPSDKKVNFFCLMLEAYNDFSRFEELEFTEDIYAKYRELEALGYSGTLMTDIFSGDTKTSEREFLTGLPFPYLDNFKSKSNSYVWYLRQNGYTTEGAHPVTMEFYDRINVNANLGFENYYFEENYFKAGAPYYITWDAKFIPELKKIYDARDKSKPYFNFSVSYQGHGPYSATDSHFETPYVKSDHVSEADKNILNNYLHAQKQTTELLYTFVTEMLATEDPLVIVLFGDHKPWMGDFGHVYGSYGISIDTSTPEGFANYYSTRYLIIANDAAKELCQNDFSGEGETLSPHFLMNKVFELCGYSGNAYMQFSRDIMKETPVVHRAMTLPTDYDNVSYYYRRNFAY